MTNIKNISNRIFSMTTLVEIVLVIFAVASASTISDYFIHSKMNNVTSYAIGIGMGLILVIMSILLSRVDTKAPEFRVLLIATIAVGILSAILQSMAYVNVTQHTLSGIVKGTGFPLVEIALAYSVSRYVSYTKQKELDDADKEFDKNLARLQREAMQSMTSENIKEKMQDKLEMIAEARMTFFVDSQLSKYSVVQPNRQRLLPIKTRHVSTNVQDDGQDIGQTEIMSKTEEENVQDISKDNDVDTSVKTDNFSRFVQLLMTKYDGQDVDTLDKKDIAGQLDVTPRTISRYIGQLRTEHRLNGVVHKEIL